MTKEELQKQAKLFDNQVKMFFCFSLLMPSLMLTLLVIAWVFSRPFPNLEMVVGLTVTALFLTMEVFSIVNLNEVRTEIRFREILEKINV